MFVKYAQNYSLFIYFFNSTEVRTEALEIFCVMIPLLVDTWPVFALFCYLPHIQIFFIK